MGYFTSLPPEKISLDNPEYWVEIKSDIKYGEAKEFISVTQDGKINQSAALDAFLKTVIVAWNLDDGDGNIVPIDEEHINQLSQKDAITIIQKAGALVQGDQEKKADFLEKSGVSTTPAQ